ncbi:MAG TPA: histidine phosphatase family protein [Candidatus Limnocylindrales bacterium]|nr:histidine phosphatase family protein [Candidatus Limnocylindrales bacterium]
MSRSQQVVIVRHGETAWSRDGRHTGWTDIPLTPQGRAEAEALRVRLERCRFRAVFASPLQRAVDTCRLAGLSPDPQLRDELREWDYGRYDGLTLAEIERARPGWSLWRDGCPGGEDAAAGGARADRALAEIRQAPGPVAVVAHGHLLRVLTARWLGLAPEGGRYFALSPAGLGVLGYEHEDPVIDRWNVTPDF